MTVAGFDGRARVASGSAPTRSAIVYQVSVSAGSLRLGPAASDGIVLDVPLSRVRTHPLGRAGSVVVDVDDSHLLLNFADTAVTRDGTTGSARLPRLIGAARGRRRRSHFLRAIRGGPA